MLSMLIGAIDEMMFLCMIGVLAVGVGVGVGVVVCVVVVVVAVVVVVVVVPFGVIFGVIGIESGLGPTVT